MVPSRAAMPNEKGRPKAAFLKCVRGAYCFMVSSLFILLGFLAFLAVFLLILSLDMSSPLLMVSSLFAAGAPTLSWAKAVEERGAKERKAEERKVTAAVAISLRIR